MAKGKLRFLGHSFFEFTTAQGEVILFDPWTADAGNPAPPPAPFYTRPPQ